MLLWCKGAMRTPWGHMGAMGAKGCHGDTWMLKGAMGSLGAKGTHGDTLEIGVCHGDTREADGCCGTTLGPGVTAGVPWDHGGDPRGWSHPQPR